MGLTRSCADGEGLRVVGDCGGGRQRGRQFSRSACGSTPAFGRAVRGFFGLGT